MEQFHGDFYKIRSENVSDFNGTAIYLRHKSGMEVLHLKCDDEENLFAFAFRTPIMNNKGLPHIMEHSVLCGSQKYPLKEPFINLMRTSVNTFLNAMTYPDVTVYPAASINITDYYNLMAVYGDAVFFPLLTENAFLQEARRLELRSDGGASIEGVVYNEMKGAYSSFASVASDCQTAAMMKGTCYAHDSGGDPLDIARLTYQEFKDFHKKYYRLDNCLLFLYGNESTKKQLDFVQSEFLDRLEYSETPSRALSISRKDMMSMMRSTPFDHEITCRADGPDSDSGGAQVTLNWRVAPYPRSVDDMVTASFLLQLLAGNDTCPVTKALNASSLGERLVCGINPSTSDYIMYFGLGSVAQGNEESVRSIIMDTLHNVKNTGFSQDEIDTATLAIDFSLREKVRTSDGPFSLVLMESAVSAWVYGSDPISYSGRIKPFEALKKRMHDAQNQSEFCLELLNKMLLSNADSAFLIVTPKASYIEGRKAKEAALTEELLRGADKSALEARLKSLHDAQARQETAEEVSCIPSLRRADLSSTLDPITTELQTLDGIHLITAQTETNGIVYFRMLFPIDTLNAEDLPYLNLLSSTAFSTGANGQKWDDVLKQLNLCTGGVYVSPVTSTLYDSESARKYLESVKQYQFTGRDWMSFAVKFPVELADKALTLFASLLKGLDFDDEERLRVLIAQEYDDLRSSVIPMGSKMAAMRSRCRMTRENALDEVWNGIRQLFTMRSLVSAPVRDVGARLKAIMQRIVDSGVLVNVTADSADMQKIMNVLHQKGILHSFKHLTPKPLFPNDEAVYGLTLLPGETADMRCVTYTLKSQVGFSALCWHGGKLDYGSEAATTALCRWMGSGVLWEKIRTLGGAYGANGYVRPRTGVATFTTYRDPAPNKSIETIKQCVKIACDTKFSDEQVEHLITGSYSDYVEPLSPYRYGSQGLLNALYGMTNEDRTLGLKALVELTSQMLHNEAVSLWRSMEGGTQSSVLSQEPYGGNVIDLGL